MVFEGIDGSGTTTQRTQVAERLRARGHRVHETREPSDGRIGALTRGLLAGVPGHPRTIDAAGLALLFAADRLEHLAREIEPALDRGEIVICDRYVVSSWVYQSLECDPDWVRTINEHARWPDLTFVFDVSAEIALARVAARRDATGEVIERFDVPETQRRLAHGYTAMLDEDLPGLVRIDATEPIDTVTESILSRCLAAGL
ncbi:dTMP kinase [Enhygromyxa salina]|uniref:dTMP kinase n=1 Tax=Enhygromyxa salina TaxID=215803 RepID=UPI0015E5AEC7|nr:dTMP kinase [Enhygromyxa salina]